MCKELRSFFILSILMVITGGLFTSCDQRSAEGMIIMTQVDWDQETTNFNSTDFPRVLSGAQIMMMDPANPQRQPLLLSKDFYSAFSPAISFNAKKMVFAGQKNQHDTWQIYEMDLASLQYKPLTNSEEN